jgi:hypothetical protein
MANDVDIVIAARDQASKILDGIGEHALSLATNVNEMGKKVQDTGSKVEVSFENMAIGAAVLTAAYGAFTVAANVAEFLDRSLEAFELQEEAIRSLTDTLTLTSAAQDSAEDFIVLADAMEAATNIDSNKLIGLIRGIVGTVDSTQIDDVTKAATGLAKVFDTDLTGGLAKVNLALDGNFAAFERFIPGISLLSTQAEKLAAVSALASQGLDMTAAAASESDQVFIRMSAEMTNLYEVVGGIVSPFQTLAYDAIAVTAEVLTQSLNPAIEDFQTYFTGMTDSVAAGATWFAETIVGSFTLAEVIIFNLPTVFEIAGASILLSLESMRANIMQTLTVEIPAYAIWFGENFLNILQDTSSAILTVINNLGSAMGEAFVVIFDYLSGGFFSGESIDAFAKLGEIAQRDLLAGFEPVTTALPEIAERALTETEISLSGFISNATDGLGDEFETKFNERMDAVSRGMTENPLDTKINLEVDEKRKVNVEGNTSALQAVESRILVRGPSEGPMQQISQYTQQTVQELKEIKVALQNQRPATDAAAPSSAQPNFVFVS